MDHHDYLLKTVLRDYQARRDRNSAFSLRSYARFLGIQPSGLSDILAGKRKISRKMGSRIVARLPVKPDVAAELTSSLKGKYSRSESDPSRQYLVLERATFEVISRWYFLATLTLAELDDFEGTPEWVAKRLGISRMKAEEALRNLVVLKFLDVDPRSKKLRPTHKNFTSTMDIPNLAIQRSHQEHLELASVALREIAVESRDFSFINIATSPELVAEAKIRISKFRRQLCTFLETAPKKSAVFRLGTQFFPLTK